jgi:hypothetical protein
VAAAFTRPAGAASDSLDARGEAKAGKRLR